MDSDPECSLCADIALILGPEGSTPKGSSRPHTYKELVDSKDCAVCQLLVARLGRSRGAAGYQPDCLVALQAWTHPIYKKWSFGMAPMYYGACQSCGASHSAISLAESASPDPRSPYHVKLDPNWIDVERVKAWAHECDSSHHGTCHTLTEWRSIPVPSRAPLVLIDVVSQSLVEFKLTPNLSAPRYITLSYVWGWVPDVLEATKDNLAALKTPGAFSSRSLASRLPATVRDAIALTNLLGIRYLWVDRVCIVQDDMTLKLPQLEQMGSIYANSYMTIIAGDGADADYGLRGSCPGVSQPREFRSPMLSFRPGSRTIMIEPDFEGYTEWSRRGWTYQERMLSRRNLMFLDDRVFWECYGAMWVEEFALEPSRQKHPVQKEVTTADDTEDTDDIKDVRRSLFYSRSHDLQITQWPDIDQYDTLVSKYTTLVLSFPSDGLNAFLGIIQAMSRSFRGGFLYGLPEYFFDYALLWRPWLPIRRRPTGNDANLPSWSWVAWSGGRMFMSVMPPVKQYVRIGGGAVDLGYVETHPMVTWYKTNSETGMRQAIDNAYHEAISARDDQSLPLPQGWSRVNLKDVILEEESSGDDESDGDERSDNGDGMNENDREVFMHDAFPDQVFSLPIHIPETPLQPQPSSWDPLLRFRTTRAFLSIGSRLQQHWKTKLWDKHSNSAIYIAPIYRVDDEAGNFVGMIFSNESGDDEIRNITHPCEFIVLSRGITSKSKSENPDDPEDASIYNDIEEWAQIEEVKDLQTYEFFNVLWVEWSGGIAYRKALGRMWKDAWQRQHTTEIDVVLG
ncbi:putative heterokaryon incompatibility protein [Rosellinia necatrix]|uniref:Putative heterokaryon incompatibility protein n=1 Tax=Rosellinia necatrix TaxID=77044 RepID=A0A1W2TSM9_ROSNE|nr:putative heterokaryon incompatibility protein [Rosellinia necatrix]